MRARGAIVLAAVLWAALGGTAQAENLVVRSFDGTPIVAHWFPNPSLGPGERAPVVLNGPGWSSPGEKDPSRGAIKRLHDLGYNVLTWDPRGFGVSGGEATIDAPLVEGRDVKALISVMARQPAGARYVLQLVAGTRVWARQRTTGVLEASSVRVEVPVASPRGLGRRGVRCQDKRSVRFRLRREVAGGRVLLDGRVIGRVPGGSRTVRVRFDRRALGAQRLRLVLRLASGRTVVRKRTLFLCGAG
jgi:hypothetical protein